MDIQIVAFVACAFMALLNLFTGNFDSFSSYGSALLVICALSKE